MLVCYKCKSNSEFNDLCNECNTEKHILQTTFDKEYKNVDQQIATLRIMGSVFIAVGLFFSLILFVAFIENFSNYTKAATGIITISLFWICSTFYNDASTLNTKKNMIVTRYKNNIQQFVPSKEYENLKQYMVGNYTTNNYIINEIAKEPEIIICEYCESSNYIIETNCHNCHAAI